MNKRALYFTVICLYLSFSGFAQVYEDFNLSEYVTPDIVRSQLDFSLRTAGSFTDNETSKNDLFRINGDLNTAFDKYKNTRPYWNRQLLVVGMSGNYRNELKEKKSDYGLTFNYQNVNRFYTSDMRFFEVSPSVDVQLLGYKTGGLLVDVKTHNNSYYANIPMSVGKGRIEQVEDARQAIYILENLDKQGVLNRKLTTEEIHAFAQTISTVKNKRFLDARLRMIVIAIGYKHMKFRDSLFAQFYSKIPFATIIHKSCLINSSAKIKQGSVIYPGCIIDKNGLS